MAVRNPACVPAALLAVLALAPSGCSFLFAKGPPAHHEHLRYFDCNTSKAPAVLDTLIAVPAVLVAAAAASEGHSGEAAAPALVYAAGFGASAIYGYNAASECSEAQAKLVERIEYGERVDDALTRGRGGAPGRSGGRKPTWQGPSPWETPPQGYGAPGPSGPNDPWSNPGGARPPAADGEDEGTGEEKPADEAPAETKPPGEPPPDQDSPGQADKPTTTPPTPQAADGDAPQR